MMKKYTVYKHTTPNGMVYIGVTSNYKERCFPSLYRSEPFKSHIQSHGWNNIKHEIIKQFDNKKDALLLEDALIKYYKDEKISLNKNRSGYGKIKKIEKDTEKQERKKERISNYKKHKEYYANYYSNFRNTNEGKIYYRVNAHNQYCKKIGRIEYIIETPAEARKKYLDFGYIPSYIKNDDIYY